MIRLAARLAALALLVMAVSAPAHNVGSNAPLPVIGPAPPFALTSQDGKPVALADLHGKVVAVTFIYTECPDICPLLTQKMVTVQEALGADFATKIDFVSITLDPAHDTPAVLKDYAHAFGANTAGWSFLTGSPRAVGEVTRRYGVFFAKQPDGSVEHTQLTTLVDAAGRMRVQYLGARFAADEFRHDLLRLAAEE
jgi:protein SCO1